ncbi:DUF4126 domain-containing protein [Leptolyngbya ohadii]|uniref:DUF4126 domain-containing protein n=1 Tax=Leptolyngbya ohadii TaxID=1962290 RepID=UPI000B59E0B0|nr:DUF4126 domain-containing protein [Leptolyngbya ohadii]
MDVLLQLAVGIGLSAAAGFRILIPFLVMSMAAQGGYLRLAPEMAWISSQEATIAFGVAAALEVLIYFIPVVDNFMDLIEVPAAAIAGTILTATVTSDLDPWLRWSLAAVAGGTVAGGTGALTGMTRLASTAVAGPVGNAAVGSAELASSGILSILAIAVPILALIVILVIAFLGFRQVKRRLR